MGSHWNHDISFSVEKKLFKNLVSEWVLDICIFLLIWIVEFYISQSFPIVQKLKYFHCTIPWQNKVSKTILKICFQILNIHILSWSKLKLIEYSQNLIIHYEMSNNNEDKQSNIKEDYTVVGIVKIYICSKKRDDTK